MLSEEVFCASIASSSLSSRCHHCLLGSDILRKCTGCKFVHYCSGECQKADWRHHKAECSIFKASWLDNEREYQFSELTYESAQKFTDSIRLVLRLAVLWTQGEFGQVDTVIGTRSLPSLEEHSHDAKLELESLMFLEQFKKFVRKKIAGDEVIKRLFKKSSINSFGITDEYGHSFGVSLCIKLSGVDHSCKPMARLIYRGRYVSLLPTKRGTCLSLSTAMHSYIDELLPRSARQEMLKEKYKFDCNCDGCEDEERNELMESWVCENCEDGWLPAEENARCERCGIAAEESHIRTCMMVSETVSNNNRILGRKDIPEEKKHSLATMLMGMMDGATSKMNVLRLPCLRYLYKEAVDGQRMMTAKNIGEQILFIYLRYRNPEDIAVCYFKYGLAKIVKALGDDSGAAHLVDDVLLHCFEDAYGKESDIYHHCLQLNGSIDC